MSLAQRLGLQGPSNIPKRFLPFYQQAGSEALVRYAPQYDALNEVRAASAQTMRQRVAQARTAGAILSNGATMAVKELTQDPNAKSPAISSLIGMLGSRIADANTIADQQVQQATNEHMQDLDKIHAQRASLLGQIGTFTIGRATDLVGSDRKLRHDVNVQKRNLANARLTSGVDATGHVVPGGPKDPKITHPPKPPAGPSTIAKPPSSFTGSPADWNAMSRVERDAWVKQHPSSSPKATTGVPNPGNITLLPPGEQSTQVTRIQGAFANVKDLMSHPNAHKAEIEHGLRAGFVDGVKYTQPQIDVAFDLWRNKGRVSNRGAHKLHTIGVSVGGHFKPLPKPRRPGLPQAGGPVGVPTPRPN